MRCRLIGKPGSISEEWVERISRADREMLPGRCDRRTSDKYWWIVLDGEKLAAYASAKVVGSGVHLSRCGVLHGYRGRGLQRKLIRCRVAYFRRRGYFRFHSYTGLYNFASANNLIRCGFLLSKRQHRDFISFTLRARQ